MACSWGALFGMGCQTEQKHVSVSATVPTKFPQTPIALSNPEGIVSPENQAKEWLEFTPSEQPTFTVTFPGLPKTETQALKDGTIVREYVVKKLSESFLVHEEIRTKVLDAKQMMVELDSASIKAMYPLEDMIAFSKQQGRIQATFVSKIDKDLGRVLIKTVSGKNVVTAMVEYSGKDVARLSPNPFIDSFRVY